LARSSRYMSHATAPQGNVLRLKIEKSRHADADDGVTGWAAAEGRKPGTTNGDGLVNGARLSVLHQPAIRSPPNWSAHCRTMRSHSGSGP
jgi:hypothetical protein